MPDAGLQFHKEENPLPQRARGEFSVAWGILIYIIRFVKANEKLSCPSFSISNAICNRLYVYLK